MRTSPALLVCSALAAFAAAASQSHAQFINLYGDLGPQATTGIVFSPIFTNTTTPFTWSAPAGNITGDVIMDNDITGTIFSLTITNLTYNCIIPNASGFGDVVLVVQHSYATSGSGTYTGSHSLSGGWTSGPLSVVQLDTILDFGGSNTSLTSLIATTSPFTLGPSSGSVLSTSAVFTIQSIIRFHTDGAGNVTLPSSAHITATLIPAPSAGALSASAASSRRAVVEP